ncbi:hypothetical protein M0R19_05000 [Candidatus Pacearchaeota archaeon]|nr:hypothetical protein [Candidatus Pacearchaeota archaeon]
MENAREKAEAKLQHLEILSSAYMKGSGADYVLGKLGDKYVIGWGLYDGMNEHEVRAHSYHKTWYENEEDACDAWLVKEAECKASESNT